MQKRLKVLISAYACEFGKGSEPGVGWNWVKQIARFHDVWVITRANNRKSIESEDPHSSSEIKWIYFDYPAWARFWKRGQRGVHLYYYLWQIAIYFLAKRIHKQVKFDIVHHLTLGFYWMPSFMFLLPVPFVYGPLGGAESSPRTFYKSFSVRGQIYEYLRNTARWLGEKDPFVLMSIRRAKLVLARVRETGERVVLLGAKQVETYTELGINSNEFKRLESIRNKDREQLIVISVGRLLHWKGFHLGLRAFSKFVTEFPSSEYWFVGDGPERRNLEQQAERLGVHDKVKFYGEVPRHEALKRLTNSDILIHPSLHDSGGWVCLEAMALGKPVLCLDIGGPAMQVSDKTGFKIPATTPEQSVDDIVNALKKLAVSSSLCRQMGNAARKRALEYFDWNKKGEWINKKYQELVI
jgi:glycosyltransferase involved in cell wall biosynthesis